MLQTYTRCWSRTTHVRVRYSSIVRIFVFVSLFVVYQAQIQKEIRPSWAEFTLPRPALRPAHNTVSVHTHPSPSVYTSSLAAAAAAPAARSGGENACGPLSVHAQTTDANETTGFLLAIMQRFSCKQTFVSQAYSVLERPCQQHVVCLLADALHCVSCQTCNHRITCIMCVAAATDLS